MTLAPGSQLGPYQILTLLGKGGMGEVWRARDTKLGREVAIKTLATEFAQDRDRRARLDQEARALAVLNHPNIASIYGLEERDGVTYLVLELVDGSLLSDEIAKGPMPLGRALAVASQIAEALEAAHEAGIIHRDLKPANIKLRPDGSVKLLDFGLARSVVPIASSGDFEQTLSVLAGTLPGMVLGTLAYMSPEQARGVMVDRRTDIFSFGCVVYECLTARQAFGGSTATDALTATVHADPDWSQLPDQLPQPVRDLLHRCLRKNPRERLQSIGDARVILQEQGAAPGAIAPGQSATSRAAGRTDWRVVAAALAAGVIGGMLVARLVPERESSPVNPSPTIRSTLPLSPGVSLSPGGLPSIAISPDGQTVVFRGSEGGVTRLYRRRLDGGEVIPIAGTESGVDPFFSPDGNWVAFFTSARLKKVSLAGGAPVDICPVPPIAGGGTWTSDGWILFSRGPNFPLSRVSASGGRVDDWSQLDATRGEHAHLWPQALPGGRVLVTMVFGRDFQDLSEARAVLISPGEQRRDLQEGSAFARIVAGWLVFVGGDTVLAAPFDSERFEVTGPSIRVAESIVVSAVRRTAHFAATETGTLVFASGPPLPLITSDLVRVDRTGRATPLAVEPAAYNHVRLSPDAKRIALARSDGMSVRLFMFDDERQVLSPFTPEAGRYFLPVWSPDGKRLAFTGFQQGEPRLYVRNTDGSDPITTLTEPAGRAEFPNSWSPDGRVLAYTVAYVADESASRRRGTSDIWLLTLDRSTPPHPWFETPDNETGATFSPDGRFLAYVSDESGRREVYVRPFPGPGGKTQVSSQGGAEPTWSSNGQEILYRVGDRFLAAALRAAPQPVVSASRELFAGPFVLGGRHDDPRAYDVSRDGSFIVAVQPRRSERTPIQLGVVTNWPAALARTATDKR